MGECAAGNILSGVCRAQPCKGTPRANVAFRRPPRGCQGPLFLAGFGDAITQDSQPERHAPPPEARTHSSTAFLPSPRQNRRMEAWKEEAISVSAEGRERCWGRQKDGVRQSCRREAVARAFPPALGWCPGSRRLPGWAGAGAGGFVQPGLLQEGPLGPT